MPLPPRCWPESRLRRRTPPIPLVRDLGHRRIRIPPGHRSRCPGTRAGRTEMVARPHRQLDHARGRHRLDSRIPDGATSRASGGSRVTHLRFAVRSATRPAVRPEGSSGSVVAPAQGSARLAGSSPPGRTRLRRAFSAAASAGAAPSVGWICASPRYSRTTVHSRRDRGISAGGRQARSGIGRLGRIDVRIAHRVLLLHELDRGAPRVRTGNFELTATRHREKPARGVGRGHRFHPVDHDGVDRRRRRGGRGPDHGESRSRPRSRSRSRSQR